MKTKEQIETANSTIQLLQDYVELAKVEKKLKIQTHKDTTSEMLTNITVDIEELTKLL